MASWNATRREPAMSRDYLTAKEIKKLAINAVYAKSDTTRVVPEEEMQAVMEWAHRAIVEINCLSLALKGEALVDIRDGEAGFRRAREVLSPEDLERFHATLAAIDQEPDEEEADGQ